MAMAVGLSTLLVLVAIVAGALVEIRFWNRIIFDIAAVVLGVALSLAMVTIAVAMVEVPWAVFDPLRRDLALVCKLFENSTTLDLLLVSLAAGISEEAMFRGLLQPLVGRLTGPTLAVLVVGLVFGLLHAVSPTYFASATVLGIGFGFIFLWSGNLLILIVAHFLFDFLVLFYGVKLRPVAPPPTTIS